MEVEKMLNNFERGKVKAVENALNVLERFTDLRDRDIIAIRKAVKEKKRLVCIPR